MKTSVKWIIGLGAAAVAFIVIACILFFSTINVNDIRKDVLDNNGVIFNKSRVKNIELYDNAPIAGVEKIEIDVGSGDVEINETEGKDLTVSVNGKYYNVSDSAESYKLELTETKNTLTLRIKQDWRFFNIGSFFIGEIKIDIPETFDGALDLKVGSGSVDFNVNNEFSDVKLEVFSGDVDINSINCGNSNIIVNSGSLTIQNIETVAANIEVFSGSLIMNNCDVKGNLKTTVHSGFAGIKGGFKTLNAIVHSGMADIKTTKEIAGDYKIEVHSGTFCLKLPGSSYNLIAYISSGSLKDKAGKWHLNDFDTGSGYKIEFVISSGYAEIN